MKEQTTYAARGVSADKKGVHKAVSRLDPGLFPGAFCRIYPDYLSGSKEHRMVQHADGAGTKATLGYMAVREGGNAERIWRGIAQDSLAMNLDDAACVGALDPYTISMTIDRNAGEDRVSDYDIAGLIGGTQDICEKLREIGVECRFLGGETADMGDAVRCIAVGHTLTSRFHRTKIVDASRITAPAVIVGFSSIGQANWESSPNSGIGANGLTNARHDLLDTVYRERYPETFAPETPSDLIYRGKYFLESNLKGTNFTVGEALLSPTRIYTPMIMHLIEELGALRILALIHCTGGGQTKIVNFGPTGITFVKSRLFETPPLFLALQEEQELSWKEMYRVYNMGHLLEAVLRDESDAERAIVVAKNCGIEAQIIGRVIEGRPGVRRVSIQSPHGEFKYDQEAV